MRNAAHLICVTVLLLTPAHAAWREGVKLSEAMPSAQAVALEGEVFVLRDQRNRHRKMFFEAYDIDGDGWRPLPPVPVDSTDFSVAAAGGQIILTGGRQAQNEKPRSTVWVYSPTKSLWYQAPPMPEARAGHISIALNERVYVFGGGAEDKRGKDKILVFDVQSSVWSSLPSPSFALPHQGAAIAAGSGKIMLAGGIDKNGKALTNVHIFDPANGAWTQASPLPQALSGGRLAAVSGKKGIAWHYFGGYRLHPSVTFAAHYILPSKGAHWQEGQAMPQARHSSAVAVWENDIVVIGGAVGSGFYTSFTGTDSVYIFTPEKR